MNPYWSASLLGSLAVILGQVIGCASTAENPEEESGKGRTSYASSTESATELGVVRWERREEAGEGARQSYLIGRDRDGVARVLARIRVEHDRSGDPKTLEINQVTTSLGESTTRFSIQQGTFTIEQNGAADRPDVARALELLQRDFIAGVASDSGQNANPRVASSPQPASMKPLICLTTACSEMEAGCNEERRLITNECNRQLNTCIGGDTENGSLVSVGEPPPQCYPKYHACVHPAQSRVECAADAQTPWGVMKCALGYGCGYDKLFMP